jgi:hypothetical protein
MKLVNIYSLSRIQIRDSWLPKLHFSWGRHRHTIMQLFSLAFRGTKCCDLANSGASYVRFLVRRSIVLSNTYCECPGSSLKQATTNVCLHDNHWQPSFRVKLYLRRAFRVLAFVLEELWSAVTWVPRDLTQHGICKTTSLNFWHLIEMESLRNTHFIGFMLQVLTESGTVLSWLLILSSAKHSLTQYWTCLFHEN